MMILESQKKRKPWYERETPTKKLKRSNDGKKNPINVTAAVNQDTYNQMEHIIKYSPNRAKHGSEGALTRTFIEEGLERLTGIKSSIEHETSKADGMPAAANTSPAVIQMIQSIMRPQLDIIRHALGMDKLDIHLDIEQIPYVTALGQAVYDGHNIELDYSVLEQAQLNPDNPIHLELREAMQSKLAAAGIDDVTITLTGYKPYKEREL